MQLPGPLRAAVGLVAAAADEARHLPDRAIELPMLAVSTALQVSLRLQQRYARFTARGDAILNGRRGSDDPPDWATFDAPVSGAEFRDLDRGDSVAQSTARTAADAGALLEEVFDVETPVNGAVDAGATAKSAVRKPRNGRSSAAGRSSVARTAAKKSTKTVSKPRHAPPSPFDSVPDGANDNVDDSANETANDDSDA